MGFRGNERGIVAKATAAASTSYSSDPTFEQLNESLLADGENIVNKVKGALARGGPNGAQVKWAVDVKNGSGSLTNNATAKANCTITMKDSDLVCLMNRTLNQQKSLFQGKLKKKGNMGLAMKLNEFQKTAQNHLQSNL
ncbi:unnamed protein product [Meganyctiphanes norvegica]|uniref:SCP2 domain-containing protein n=1 Tax=Meganyctiphanes norvegica TaxID=48144 RepID=A0AAV2RS87_MEGNR